MKISLPKIHQPYEVQSDIWIDGDFQPNIPTKKYLEASGRLEEYDARSHKRSEMDYAQRSYKGSDVYYTDPSQKLLLCAGDVIEFCNFYPGFKKSRAGFEFKFLSSKSPMLLHSKTVFKGAVDDELELKEVAIKKIKGTLKNFISPKVLAFSTVGSGSYKTSNGIWAKYVDAIDPSQSFEELMQPTNLEGFHGTAALSTVIESAKKKQITSYRAGFVFPYVSRYRPEPTKPWASFIGNSSGTTEKFSNSSSDWERVFKGLGYYSDCEKWLKKLYQKFKCIPDGYFPFLFVDGHKFQHSYIPAEVMLLGGFMSNTELMPKAEKVPASFPFENGRLSFHNNIIKAV
jgi:hypothetical protein